MTGVLLLGYLGQAFITMGDTYLFSSAVAVAVGGASILGGKGHYIGTVAGAIILTLITANLNLISLGDIGDRHRVRRDPARDGLSGDGAHAQ